MTPQDCLGTPGLASGSEDPQDRVSFHARLGMLCSSLVSKGEDRRNSPKQNNKICKFLKKLELPLDPIIQLLDTRPKDVKIFVHIKICTLILTRALFIKAETTQTPVNGWLAGGGGKRGVTANADKVSFVGNENVLELIVVMVAQPHEYPRNH